LRDKSGRFVKGVLSAHFKGGKIITTQGYVKVWNQTIQDYEMEHRKIWEEHYQCCLLSWTEVHHKNKNKTDNRIDNLEAILRPEHTKIHHPLLDMAIRKCNICNRTEKGRKWHKDIEGYICPTCYFMIKYWKKKLPITS